jgi:hypothetical protein
MSIWMCRITQSEMKGANARSPSKQKGVCLTNPGGCLA